MPAHQPLLLGATAVSFARLRARLKLNADTHRQDLRNILPFICSLPNPHRTCFLFFFVFIRAGNTLCLTGKACLPLQENSKLLARIIMECSFRPCK